jgi:uncharacterized membrane protein YedE/YeeE
MSDKAWNPYLAGALAGLLLVASVAVAGHYLGASTTFARGAAYIEDKVGVDTGQFEYFTAKGGKYGAGSLPNWQLLFVAGIMIGSFAVSRLSGTFRFQPVPDMWAERFGPSPVRRGVAAFFGGAVLLFGARLAGGCPSGHGLSGLSQLAVSGFIALAFFFLAGAITARFLYSEQRSPATEQRFSGAPKEVTS